jgi:peptide/nickel transport system permease protein/oligopeptide transport system permease protein
MRWFGSLRRDWSFAIVLAVLAFFLLTILIPGVLAPYDPYEQHPRDALQPPSAQYWFGTDQFGRDILSRLIYGGRVALLVGIGSVALATLVGVPLGLYSGYYGGPVDSVIMRIQDALLAFPAVLLALLIIASFGASAVNVVLTIAIVFVPRFARLVRGSVMALKEREFVLASRAIGAKDRRILSRAILPNTVAPITVQITLGIAIAILIESGLSYLGLGIQPPTASWGNMLQHAHSYIYQAPWFVVATGSIIFVAVLVFNLAGDRLREIVDPRLRKL